MNTAFLLLINGPAGVGKSTLAQRLHNDYPWSYLLDIDSLKFNFSHFREDNGLAVKKAIDIAVAISDHLLGQNHCVIVDRMLFQKYDSIDRFNELAIRHALPFIELYLTARKEVVVVRAHGRGFARQIEGGLNPDKIEQFYDAMSPELSDGFVIDTSDLSPDEVYVQAIEIISNQLRGV